LQALAAHGADLNAHSKVPEFPKVKVDAATMVFTALPRGGLTALMLAARQGAQGGVRALADAGADLNAVDADGTTALNIAVINAHYDVAALLIEKGADLNIGDAAGMTPLYAAIDMQHQEPMINRPLPRPSGKLLPADVVTLLLDRGAESQRQAQDAAAHASAQRWRPDARRGCHAADACGEGERHAFHPLLLDKGADPNLRLRNQTTALMIAASRAARNAGPEQQTIDAMQLLIAKGADVNAGERQRRIGLAHRRRARRRTGAVSRRARRRSHAQGQERTDAARRRDGSGGRWWWRSWPRRPRCSAGSGPGS
jgi:ankyrin repeat protein